MDGVKNLSPKVSWVIIYSSLMMILWPNSGKSYDFILSADGRIVPEDLSPNLLKLEPVSDGFVIHNITGIKTQIVRRLDDQGYEIRRRMLSDITAIQRLI